MENDWITIGRFKEIVEKLKLPDEMPILILEYDDDDAISSDYRYYTYAVTAVTVSHTEDGLIKKGLLLS